MIEQSPLTITTTGRGTTELTVPFARGRLLLGTWQGLYLFEHRSQGHTRQLVVTLQGE